MSVRAVTHSTLWQIASQFTMAVLSIITVKFVAIGLSKELVGNYNSSYAFLQLFGILADFGLYAVAVRELSRAEDKSEMLGVLITLRSIILALSLSIALLIAFAVPKWQGTPLPIGIVLASFVPFFTLLAGILRTIFQVTYKMHFVFIAEVVQRIITVSLIGMIIVTGYRTSDSILVYEYAIGAGGIGAFVLFLLSLFFGHRLIPIRLSWNKKLMKKTLRSALPYGFAFLCISIYRQFDVTMIALLRPDFETQNAYYGFVLRMTEVGYLVPTFLLNSVLPMLSDRDAKSEDTSSLLSKTFFMLLLFGTICMLFTMLWARPLVSLLTTESYLSTVDRPGSDSALMLLSIPLFLNGLIQLSFYTLLTRHAWKTLVTRMVAAAAFSVLLNLAMIPLFGFVGAAITAIVIHLFLVLILWPASQKVFRVHLAKGLLAKWLLFSLGLAIVLILFRPLIDSVPMTIVGGVAAGAAILGLLQALNIPSALGMRSL